MKRPDNKSSCPVNFSVEIFGDTWSLLIIRDIVADGKKTFNEFLQSKEAISPAVLANRLIHLETKGIITKSINLKDKRKTVYALTEEGLNALPILYELSAWGTRASKNPEASNAWFEALELDKATVLNAWRDAVKAGGSFSTGPKSVIKTLRLVTA